jgi:hypothetical protein
MPNARSLPEAGQRSGVSTHALRRSQQQCHLAGNNLHVNRRNMMQLLKTSSSGHWSQTTVAQLHWQQKPGGTLHAASMCYIHTLVMRGMWHSLHSITVNPTI